MSKPDADRGVHMHADHGLPVKQLTDRNVSRCSQQSCSTLPSARQEMLVLLQQDASAFSFVSFLYAAQFCTVLFSHLCAILKLLTVSGDITPLAPAFCAELLH